MTDYYPPEVWDAFCDSIEAQVDSMQYRPEGHNKGCSCTICIDLDLRVATERNHFHGLYATYKEELIDEDPT